MRHPQIVVYESSGDLAAMVSQLATENGWLVRESRQAESCLQLLREVRPSVCLVKLERRLIEEMKLTASIREQAPECPVIVVSDVKMENAEQRALLTALAYDLGARHIVFPPWMKSAIEDLVSGLMAATIRRGGNECVNSPSST